MSISQVSVLYMHCWFVISHSLLIWMMIFTIIVSFSKLIGLCHVLGNPLLDVLSPEILHYLTFPFSPSRYQNISSPYIQTSNRQTSPPKPTTVQQKLPQELYVNIVRMKSSASRKISRNNSSSRKYINSGIIGKGGRKTKQSKQTNNSGKNLKSAGSPYSRDWRPKTFHRRIRTAGTGLHT